MDASEKRKSKPDFMDRIQNNPKLGFMYASAERNSKPEDLMDGIPNNPKLGFMYAPEERNSKPEDLMDGIPNNPKLGFMYAPEERTNSKAGVMDRIVPPRTLPPDFIREAIAKAAKARASALDDDYDDDAYWCNLEKVLHLPEISLDGGRWGRRRGKGCLVFSGLEIEMERAAAERRGRRKKSAGKDKPILAEGFA